MKKKLIKLWGIGMAMVLVASLFIVGAVPASADTLEWEDLGGFSKVPKADYDVGKLAVTPTGEMLAIVDKDGDGTVDAIYNSFNAYKWSEADLPSGLTIADIVDIAVSPAFETDGRVFALVEDGSGDAQVILSTDGGDSFGTFSTAQSGTPYSIAVAPNYVANNGEIMISTSANVYIWEDSSMSWSAAGDNPITDAFDAEFSPNFPIDGTRVAVGTHLAVDGIHTLVGSDDDWNDTLTTPATITSGAVCEIEFPSDFLALDDDSRTLFVSIEADTVYRAEIGSGDAADDIVNSVSWTPQSICYTGTLEDGALFAGAEGSTKVYRSDNADDSTATDVEWRGSSGAPTGTGNTYVAVSPYYATTGTVYAGTSGATGDNSAFSISNDQGKYFYQTGLIDTAITSILDMHLTSADEIFMLTADASGDDSLWRCTDLSGGKPHWDRIYTLALTNDSGLLAFSMDYDSDGTLVIGDTENTGSGAMYLSSDGGTSFTARAVSDVDVGCIAIKDQYNIYVGSYNSAEVQMTTNGGWWWQADPTDSDGGTSVTAIAIDPETGDILAGHGDGTVSLSQDNNGEYEAVEGDDGALDSNAVIAVAFAPDYSDSGIIYRATADSIGRFPYKDEWKKITPTAFNDGDATTDAVIQDMEVAPDGTVYVTDHDADADDDDQLHRSINPTDRAVEWSDTEYEDGNLGIFDIIAGSNIIFAYNSADKAVATYTDTLTQAEVELESPLNTVVVDSASSTRISWGEVDGADAYEYQVSTDSTFEDVDKTATDVEDLYAVITGLSAGKTYYWRVRVNDPLYSPWPEDYYSFSTQLEPTTLNAPVIIPANGGSGNTGPGGYNVSLTPTLQWGPIGDATGYNVQVSLYADMAQVNLLINETVEAVVYQITTPLEYSTTYYWRVQGISDTSETAWSSINGFTTMAEPEEPADVITVTDAPTYTINMPTQAPATTTEVVIQEEQIAEGYIWAIIIIGAVLVIAVIVLIVRTRRSV